MHSLTCKVFKTSQTILIHILNSTVGANYGEARRGVCVFGSHNISPPLAQTAGSVRVKSEKVFLVKSFRH